jgi:hypothetical protein
LFWPKNEGFYPNKKSKTMTLSKQDLFQLLRNPEKMSDSDVAKLHDMSQEYPFFQALYALIARQSPQQQAYSLGFFVLIGQIAVAQNST